MLVVDDDPQALRYIRAALTDAGFDVIVTGDHRELARIIRAEEPDLVLLDLMLPDTDGIKLMLLPASRGCQTPPSRVATTRLDLMPG